MLIDELEEAEESLKNAISPFVCALFQRFYENRRIWQPAIQVMAELDCLASLTITMIQSDGDMCRPVFLRSVDMGGKSKLDLRKMRHPFVCFSSRN